ncbi:MAG: hypothetical protein WC222_11605 [Parachlamydiales bacterium]|jgi:hypothetical protein
MRKAKICQCYAIVNLHYRHEDFGGSTEEAIVVEKDFKDEKNAEKRLSEILMDNNRLHSWVNRYCIIKIYWREMYD